jgi:hypothetical protein
MSWMGAGDTKRAEAQAPADRAVGGMRARRSRHWQGSGQGGIWMPVEKAIR